MTTRKISDQTRFIIERDEWIPDGMECEHPLCETMHKRWHQRNGSGIWCSKPAGKRVEYVIIDTRTGERPNGYDWAYDRKRDAVSKLEVLLSGLTDAEWQQIKKTGA